MDKKPVNRACPERAITALAVNLPERDLRSLRAIFERHGWRLLEAASSREALAWFAEYAIPVVICERELPDGDWRTLLNALDTLYCPPKLIVSSRLADDRLWAEVLNLGGYDVLPTPFEANELGRVLRVACLAWQRDWEGFRTGAPVEILQAAKARAAGGA
jgi:DNA-binding response OmpR family regulator